MTEQTREAFNKAQNSLNELKKLLLYDDAPEYKKRDGWHSNNLQNLIVLDPRHGEGNLGFFNGSFNTEAYLDNQDVNDIIIKADEALVFGLLSRHAVNELRIVKGARFKCPQDGEEYISTGKFFLNNGGSLIDESGGAIFIAGTRKFAELVKKERILLGGDEVIFDGGEAVIGEYYFNIGQLCTIRNAIRDRATLEDFDKIINRLQL